MTDRLPICKLKREALDVDNICPQDRTVSRLVN
jgi:hypothetical protein